MWGRPPLSALKKVKKPTLADLAGYPGMTGWFKPSLLGKLLLRVLISDVFGQYADRRLIVAALDNVPKNEIPVRDDLREVLVEDNEGAVWIDFVADLGDGFDATYAIAYLLAQEQLTVGEKSLPRGGALFMGGDEVYPTASRDEYNIKMIAPYNFAYPYKKGSAHPPIFLIPGNHDWYDGLTNFLAIFASGKPTRIGNWKTQQKRSYFAARLNDLCWLWAIDIALVADMDQPQADYFVAVAEAMSQGASIILCSAEPGWYTTDSSSYRTLSYAAKIAENAGKELRVPLVLSGDTHHYSRYETEQGTEYITSGGGGAFLHGTHHLPDTITADWMKYPKQVLQLKTCYPPKEESPDLLRGDFSFPLQNRGFAATLGALYALFGYLWSLRPCWDIGLILCAVLAGSLVYYSGYQEKKYNRTIVGLSLLHSLVHGIAFLALTRLIMAIDGSLWNWHAHGPWWAWLGELGLLMTPVGGAIAGFIFGANLYLTCRFADMNNNDAFSAMRLDSYRNFLRIRIVGDEITVYPIGFKETPKRNQWRDNPSPDDPPRSYFVPPETFKYGLIEEPIVIRSREAAHTSEMKKPGELPSEQ